MTTPDYILRFAEAIAPGNAELLLTGSTEEAILNAATDTISDLRERNAELEAQCDALLAACEAALEAIRSDADVDWMLNVESQCCAAIAKAHGEVRDDE